MLTTSGFNAYFYLKNLPVDQVKMAGIFIIDLQTDPESKAMVNSVTDIAYLMGLKVVVELQQITLERPAVSEKRLSLTTNGQVRYAVNGYTSVAGAGMRRSDPAQDTLPR